MACNNARVATRAGRRGRAHGIGTPAIQVLGGGAANPPLARTHATALLQFGRAPIGGVLELAMADIFAATDDGVGREWGQVGWRKGGGDGSGDAALGLDTLVPLRAGAGVLANYGCHQVPLGDGTIEPTDAAGLANGINVGDGGG